MPLVPVYSRDFYKGVFRTSGPLRNPVDQYHLRTKPTEPVTQHHSKETRSTYIKRLESQIDKKDVATKRYQEEIDLLEQENELREKDSALRDQQTNSEFQRRVLRIIQWPYDTNSPISQDDICARINDLRNSAILNETNVKAYNKTIKEEKKRYKDLLQKNQQLNEVCEELSRKYQENRRILEERFFWMEEEYQQKMIKKEEEHEAELMSLKRAHFRTVRELDWGVEPMNDDSIASRFTALRDDVADWTRISFKHLPRMISPEFPPAIVPLVGQMFSRKALRNGKFSSAEIIQVILWYILETNVFRPWLFGLEDPVEQSMRRIEDSVNTLDPTKTQEWRVYNIMRLRDTPQICQGRESLINEIVDGTLDCLSSIVELREDRISPDARLEKLRSIISSAGELATELKTQKAVFEMDQSVKPRVAFDPEAMTEIQFKEEPEELQARGAVVSGVISKGWIKKRGDGTVDELCRICSAMVKVV
ncbi:hypothetical protein RUND412_001159 [Rhizina undulata]